MTRAETISEITPTAEQLTDERLEVLAELARAWQRPTVFSTLTDADTAGVDAALDQLDRGEGIAGDRVFAELRQRIATAKAGA